MNQMYGNMNVYNDISGAGKGVAALNKDEAATAAHTEIKSDAGMDLLLGYKYSKGDTRPNSEDSFDEFLKMRQEQTKAKEAGIDVQETREEKEAQKEILRSITDEELKKLAMMGIDVQGARLSDLMGIINTLRGEAHREETAELMASITADNGSTDKLVAVGAEVKLAGTDISIDSVSVNELEDSDSFALGNDELVYLLRNELSINKDNLYKAHYSGSKAADNISPELMDKMQSQIEKVILRAGYEVDSQALESAELLLANELPVTTDNIKKCMEYLTLRGKTVDAVDFEKVEADKNNIAEQLYSRVQAIEPSVVYEMSSKKMEISIAAIERYGAARETYNERNDIEALTSMRRMEEIRLSMTYEASIKLVKTDINIDTRSLEQVVSELRSIEQQAIMQKLAREGIEPSAKNIELYKEVNEKITALSEAPAEVIATPVIKELYSVNAIYEVWEDVKENTASAPSVRFAEKARKSYEAVGTVPRYDMGDSIQKAFSNIDEILLDLKMEVSYENQRAVRILGYNRLPINEDNIGRIVDFDRQVNELMDSFYPEAVLGMIKDGINPLDVSIDELNKVIRNRNYNEGVSEAESFAAYLLDMEKQGKVSKEERSAYIGVFRVMNKLARSGDREAGFLFANGSRLTVRNLISAMRSKRASGIDVSIDEEFGMLDEIDLPDSRMDEQIEGAFPDKSMYDIKALEDEATLSFMKENGIDVTMVNASAVYTMLNTEGGIYSLADTLLSKLSFEDRLKEKAIDEETENMTDSLAGEDIPVDFTPESILESLVSNESMALKYEDIRNQMVEYMYKAGAYGSISALDIAAIKTVNAGFNILGGLAKEDRFFIPYETEQGRSVMNLTIRHGKSDKGNIQIRMSNKLYGEIRAELKINGKNMFGYIVSGESTGNYRLMEQREELCRFIESNGYAVQGVSFGSLGGEDANQITDTVIDGNQLYKAAVTMVKAMSLVK